MMKLFNNLLVLIGTVVFYFVFFMLVRSVLPALPDMTLWRLADFPFQIEGYPIPLFDSIFFAFGLVVFAHGVFRMLGAWHDTYLFEEADGEFGTGLYEKVRHPMYGSFMIVELGLFLSLRSLYGVAVIAVLYLFHVLNALFEEQFVLKKKFNERYAEYRHKVKAMFFSRAMTVYLLLALVLISGGIYLMREWQAA